MQALPMIASVAAPVIQGIGGLAAGKYNQRVAMEAARDELNTMVSDSEAIRADARRAIGAQVGASWANGFTGDSGTALDAFRESQINAALDVMERRRQGIARARALEAEGAMRAREGVFELAGGLLSGVSAYQGMKTDWAQAKQGTSA